MKNIDKKLRAKGFIPFSEVYNEWMKDPEFRKIQKENELEDKLFYAIIEARIKKGITQKALAEKMGTKQSAIARFESGNYNPSLSFLKKLANALGLTLTVRV